MTTQTLPAPVTTASGYDDDLRPLMSLMTGDEKHTANATSTLGC
ncbi:MAG TPA: hypothetical protein VFJ14_02050 [Nocardioidaceae bacterium]|nr:hypothetical protein [Nocardioidaceae bacterium]